MNKNSKDIDTKYDYRLLVFLLAFFCGCMILVYSLGKIQLIDGSDYKKAAYEQWASSIALKPKRGIIYDSMGKKLGVSINIKSLTCLPKEVKKGSIEREIVTEEKREIVGFLEKIHEAISSEDKVEVVNNDLKSLKEIASNIADILDMDEEEVYEKITSNKSYIVIKENITPKEEEKINEASIGGLKVIDDTKRVYPYGNFASYVLGFTDKDQKGVYGVEATYNSYLSGTPGRMIVNADIFGREMPYENETNISPSDDYSIVLTLNEILQHHAEDAAQKSLEETKAQRVHIIMMDPTNGDVLAMASKPSYDPNFPKEAMTEEMEKQWSELSYEEIQNKWFDQWRNPCVNDTYEPGSTFKPLVIAMALEENASSLNSRYLCDGYATQITTNVIKCWRYYNPHGIQTLAEILQNSCNDAMVTIGLDLGAEKLSKYITALGFGEPSGIKLNGEAVGIVREEKDMRDVNTATMSFGQGISVTPIQMVTAIACLANDGKLMEPRVVKQLIDESGNVVRNFEPIVRRQVFSEAVADEVLEMMETVVSVHGGTAAAIPGYRVAGKTGTAQKVKSGGKYAEDIYISSFVGVVPVDNPKIVCLMIVDEPVGGYYSTKICAPIVGDLMEEAVKFMGIEPTENQELINRDPINIKVPNLIGLSIKEASKVLKELKLEHNVTIDINENVTIKDQFPKAGTMVSDKQIITLILK